MGERLNIGFVGFKKMNSGLCSNIQKEVLETGGIHAGLTTPLLFIANKVAGIQGKKHSRHVVVLVPGESAMVRAGELVSFFVGYSTGLESIGQVIDRYSGKIIYIGGLKDHGNGMMVYAVMAMLYIAAQLSYCQTISLYIGLNLKFYFNYNVFPISLMGANL